MATFAVSDVTPSFRPLPATTLALSLEERIGSGVEASAANQGELVSAGLTHPFIEAVHVAFAEHYPLVLSPDDVWLCVAQGFGLHVEANAEALRSRFVRHDGKRELVVRRDEFVKGSPDNDWPGCFSEFSDQIAEHIGKKRDLVVASFSTTGPVERAASELVLMSAMKSYFDFTVVTLCGIPSITLLGTVEDWRAIRRRAEVLAEFDLAGWVAALLPVLDQFVAAATGDTDLQFWRSIYKIDSGSGGPYVNGWINVLFPYLDGGKDWNGGAQGPQPNEYATDWRAGMQPYRGTTAGSFPRGMSQTPFRWNYLGTTIPMVFWGGFSGVSQDPQTRAVRPVIGWAVQSAPVE